MPRLIDHLVLCVRDLGRAGDAYERLGFTLTPRAAHPWGTGNRLAQFGRNFLELLGLDDPARIPAPKPGEFGFGAFNRDFLTRREGMSMLVFEGRDAEADRADFAAKGLGDFARFDFSRDARLPDGATARVGFSLVFAARADWPEAAFFTCQQHAPEHFWKPAYQRHANTALNVTEVVMAASEPAAHADWLARLTGAEAAAVTGGHAFTAQDAQGCPSRVTLLSHAALLARWPEAQINGATPHFAGFRVAVADLAAAESCLSAGDVPHRKSAGALVVPADYAFGCVIEFAGA
ncbi:VOC family protein [Desertibaculum subflavum]|uniref:VOC family protein n=1 Tax=Desertibaculum subflavum TaxID=2268458 RepID=UPI0013C49A11